MQNTHFVNDFRHREAKNERAMQLKLATTNPFGFRMRVTSLLDTGSQSKVASEWYVNLVTAGRALRVEAVFSKTIVH